MEFVLRILFSGLIAFVPSEDGKELTVLLLDVGHSAHVSDGSSLPHHTPLLLARAGGCTGDCPKRDEAIAEYLFADQTSSVALDSLEAALANGGGWVLAGSELSLRKGSSSAADLPALVFQTNVRGTVNGQPRIIPIDTQSREDYSWIADMKQICGTGCTLNPAVLGSTPPSGLIAARFKLKSGKVFTYAVNRLGTKVAPAYFQRLDGQGTVSPYTQAVTTWLAADIEISGDSVEIVEEKFNGNPGRSMNLTPAANGSTVEVAVLNLPPFVPPATSGTTAPEAGKHFELFYELAQTPPAAETRLVPRAGGTASYPDVEFDYAHPDTVVWSDLLNALRLEVGRGPYDKTLCPILGW